MTKRGTLFLTTALTTLLPVGSSMAADPTYQFDIPVEPLGQALTDFSQISSQQILMSEDIARGRTTKGLHGRYTAEQALASLLAGTDLRVETNASGVLMVRLKNVEAASNDGAANQHYFAGLETVVVTGTHISGEAPVGSSVIVYSHDDITNTGATTVAEFARQIPQNSSSVDALAASSQTGALGGSAQAAGSNSFGGAGFNLRGLGPGATLTLIDGHRLAPAGGAGAFVDSSLIPLAAVDRIEVLPDGASAIYGADAVAGVVNIILRKDFDGAESSVRYGGATDGGAGELTASQVAGTQWGSGNALVVYEYDHQDGLRLDQRDYIAPQPQYSILPEQTRHSVMLNGQQSISDDATVSGDLYFSDRHNNTDTAFSDTLFSHTRAGGEQYGGSLGVAYKFDGDWSANLDGVFSRLGQPSAQRFIDSGVIQSGTNSSVSTQYASVTALANGSLFSFHGQDIRVAVGFDYRSEMLRDRETAVTPGFPNATSLDHESRDSYGAFVEVLIPLISENKPEPWARKLEISAAGRFDHYSDFGSSANPRVGVLWEPITDLSLHGAYSTSFHPPLLTQTIDNPTFFAFELPNLNSPTGQTNTLITLSSTNPGLRPEQSKSISAGFDYSPVSLPELRISGNYFNIEFTDRIDEPPLGGGGIFSIWDQAATLAPFFNTYPKAATIPQLFASGAVLFDQTGLGAAGIQATFDDRLQNIAATSESGLDASISYAKPTTFGQWSAYLSGQYILHDTYRVASSLPAVAVDNQLGEPVDLRLHGGLNWAYREFGSTVTVNYWGNYDNPFVVPEEHISSWTTVDLQLRYRLDDQSRFEGLGNLSVALTAQNLFDTRPPPVNYPAGFQPLGFDPVNASPVGRLLSLQATMDW
jgi:outer membrane receptor protein involved in Fe transport